MTRLKLSFVHRFVDRHGYVRHYFRRPGHKRAVLPGLPGSAEFMEAYQAALGNQPIPAGSNRVAAGTINALAVQYYLSARYRQLSPSTKTTYRGIIERFRAEHGDKRVAMIEATHIRKLVAAKTETPAAANNLLRMIRVLMSFAFEEGWRRDDPAQGVRKIRSRSEGFHTWTEAEITAFEAKWPMGTRERLAFAMLLYTGQRRSDVIRMGRQHVRGAAIDVVQGKTGTRLSIPLHTTLQEALAAHPTEHLTFLVTRSGAPFTAAGFTNWFRDSCNAAGLPKGCSPHGLRKAAARRLAEAGCTANQIASVTGHRTLAEVARYTRAADQSMLAETAMFAIRKRKTNEA